MFPLQYYCLAAEATMWFVLACLSSIPGSIFRWVRLDFFTQIISDAKKFYVNVLWIIQYVSLNTQNRTYNHVSVNKQPAKIKFVNKTEVNDVIKMADEEFKHHATAQRKIYASCPRFKLLFTTIVLKWWWTCNKFVRILKLSWNRRLNSFSYQSNSANNNKILSTTTIWKPISWRIY